MVNTVVVGGGASRVLIGTSACFSAVARIDGVLVVLGAVTAAYASFMIAQIRHQKENIAFTSASLGLAFIAVGKITLTLFRCCCSRTRSPRPIIHEHSFVITQIRIA